MTDPNRRHTAESAVCNMLVNYDPGAGDLPDLARAIVAEVLEIAYSPAAPSTAIPRCRQCGHRWGTNTDCETCTVGWG